MTTETETASGHPPHPVRAVRLVRSRPRLFFSAAIGLIVIAFLFATCDWAIATKLLFGWNIGIAIYLVLALSLMGRSDVHRIRRRAAGQDEGNLAILVFTVAAAIASMGAIFAELGIARDARHGGHLVLATTTIVLSWAFIHVMFALHYAHEYYGDGRKHTAGCMTFPGDGEPDYWDFAYFSFVIGMCAQVSDVTVSSKSVRRTVLAHSIIAFLFNAALLALTVNIAASAITSPSAKAGGIVVPAFATASV